MTGEIINEAQEYLTVMKGDEQKKIIDVSLLSRRHSPDNVIGFLREFLNEKRKALKKLVIKDKTDPEINEVIATMFRIYMAIDIIGKEVKHIDGAKQRAGNGGRLSGRNRSRNSSARKWKNKNNAGKNRKSDYQARRCA